MPPSPPAVLFLAHVFKGNEAFRAARELAFRPVLLTTSALLHEPWDRDALGEVLAIPDRADRSLARLAAAHLARSWRLERIIAVDDPGVDLAAELREHLCLPGLGTSEARLFRDKLAMRRWASERGIAVPAFTALFSDEDVHAFTSRVPAPWIVKPRKEASSRGIQKVADEAELWAFLRELGDRRGDYLLERFVRGPLFHVDAISAEGTVLFAEAHAYEKPLLEVAQSGGMMVTRTIAPSTTLAKRLIAENARIVDALGLSRGVTHTELLLDENDAGRRLHGRSQVPHARRAPGRLVPPRARQLCVVRWARGGLDPGRALASRSRPPPRRSRRARSFGVAASRTVRPRARPLTL